MIEKDLRGRRLGRLQRDRLNREDQIDEAERSVDAPDLHDDQAFESIVMRLLGRGSSERRDRRQEEQKKPAPREQDEYFNMRMEAFDMLFREQEERMAKLRREQEEQAEQFRKRREGF